MSDTRAQKKEPMTNEQAIGQLEELITVESMLAADESLDPACRHNRFNVQALERAVAALGVEEPIRQLLIDADSMLSAYGYGRVVTKEEAIELSNRCRKAYKSQPR